MQNNGDTYILVNNFELESLQFKGVWRKLSSQAPWPRSHSWICAVLLLRHRGSEGHQDHAKLCSGYRSMPGMPLAPPAAFLTPCNYKRTQLKSNGWPETASDCLGKRKRVIKFQKSTQFEKIATFRVQLQKYEITRHILKSTNYHLLFFY